jgi:CBS domain-containing protein
MQAQDLMTRDPVFVSPDDTAQRVAQLMDDCDCGCLPVLDRNDNNRLVGVVTDRDIAIRGIARGMGADARVRDLMTTHVVSCAPESDLADVERAMTDRQIRRVVIADADGCCLGIIAQADLARAAMQGAVRDTEIAEVVERISEPS